MVDPLINTLFDWFGYPERCCKIIPLKIAAILICITCAVSFLYYRPMPYIKCRFSINLKSPLSKPRIKCRFSINLKSPLSKPRIKCRFSINLKSPLFYFWAAAELVSTDKFIHRIVPDKGLAFNIVSGGFMAVMIGFAVATGILMIGILASSYMAVTGYLWYTTVFEFIYIPFYVATVVASYIYNNITRYIVIRAVCAVLWHCLFWYFLVVVNSYRITIWNKLYYS